MTETDSTRDELLAAGVAILAESLAEVSVDALTVRAVTRQAGRSIGSFYHYWPDRRSYRRDLLEFFTEPGSSSGEDPLVDLLEGCMPDAVVVLDAFWHHVVHVADDESLRRRILLLALDDREASAAAGRMYARSGQTMASVVARILDAADREPIAGVDVDDLAFCLGVMVEGFAIRLLADDGGATPHRVATAVTALLLSLSRPVGEDRSFADFSAALAAGFGPPAHPLDDPVPASPAASGPEHSGEAADVAVAADVAAASAARRDDHTRIELLEAGAQLLMGLTAEPSLRSVTVSAVTRRTGRSTGAFYHYWETQADFALELIDHIADPAGADEDPTVDQFETLGPRNASWPDIVDLSELRIDELACSYNNSLQHLLLFSSDSNVRSVMRSVYQRYHERAEAAVRGVLDATGAEVISGLAPADVAILLDTGLDGFGARRRGQPEALNRMRVEAVAGAIFAFTFTAGDSAGPVA
ncbi:MAG: TetR/AcrR family transcriptional regulator [Acidimicrobiales bacterium]